MRAAIWIVVANLCACGDRAAARRACPQSATDAGCALSPDGPAPVPACDARTWQREVIDTWAVPEEFGHSPSIAVDTGGGVHVAYEFYRVAELDSDLKYAYRAPSGSWAVETADEAGAVGTCPSLALDATGIPHVLYGDWRSDLPQRNLRLAYRIGAVWGIEPMASDTNGCGRLVIDTALHVAYLAETWPPDPSVNPLRYARRPSGGAWATEEIAGAYSDPTAIAINQAGRPVVGYYTEDPDEDSTILRANFAEQQADGTWLAEDLVAVDASDPCELEPGELAGVSDNDLALAFDGTNTLHFVIQDPNLAALRHLTRAPDGSLSSEVAAAAVCSLSGPALAVTPSRGIHIVYHDYPTECLREVRRDAAGIWEAEAIDLMEPGEFPSISATADADGRVHVAYERGAALVYARGP